MMNRRPSVFLLALLGAAGVVCSGAAARSAAQGASSTISAEHRALLERVRANQHRNDAALAEYERYEHRISRKENDNERIVEHKTFRVVPTGTGTLNLLVEENGKAVAPEFYRKQLADLESALAGALKTNDPAQRRRIEKFEQRRKDRAETVEAMRDAFHFRFAGREERDGRALLKFTLEPNAAFRPRTRATSVLQHARAAVWIDEAAEQFVRGEAEIISDVSFGGGILGKIYRGGKFELEQAPVADGLWLPVRFNYQLRGRKFLFGFDVNETTEIRNHRRVGPPAEALAIIRRELRGAAAGNSED
jgi:hypothetical protein